MITNINMYGCQCDNCKTEWRDEHSGFVAFKESDSARFNAEESGWYTDPKTKIGPGGTLSNDSHYCPDCWSIDDDDKVVIKSLSEVLVNKKAKVNYYAGCDFPTLKDVVVTIFKVDENGFCSVVANGKEFEHKLGFPGELNLV